jgi:hypothetical protein
MSDRCPKCNGVLIADQDNGICCLNCGWQPIAPIPSWLRDELRIGYPRSTAGAYYGPRPERRGQQGK